MDLLNVFKSKKESAQKEYIRKHAIVRRSINQDIPVNLVLPSIQQPQIPRQIIDETPHLSSILRQVFYELNRKKYETFNRSYHKLPYQLSYEFNNRIDCEIFHSLSSLFHGLSSLSEFFYRTNKITHEILHELSLQFLEKKMKEVSEKVSKQTSEDLEESIIGKMKDLSTKENESDINETDLPGCSTVSKDEYCLKDFQILRILGVGSYGRVHLVHSVHNDIYYAMKVLQKMRVVDLRQVEHTNNECKILKLVEHPFIIKMWGTCQDSLHLFIIMDFIEGGDLFTLLRSSLKLSDDIAKFYASEVVLAIEYLHSFDIIYRDLKPGNILLDKDGHIRIADLGFAKKVSTTTRSACGTREYMAPEIISYEPYNKSVDWWALGVLIYEMLSGRSPFYSKNPIKIFEKVLLGNVRYPTYFCQDAVDLMSNLITSDLTRRLGNLINGSNDIKNHQWFKEICWENVLAKNVKPPYIPPIVSGTGDTSLFEKYQDEYLYYGTTGEDKYGYLFPGF